MKNIKFLPGLIVMSFLCIEGNAQDSVTYVFQENKFESDSNYRRHIRTAYSQLFILNSDISDLTFGDQGHPDGRQYILNGNIIPHYHVFPKHWPVHLIISPQVKVRIIANQDSKPVRTPSFIPGGTFFFNASSNRDVNRSRYISVGIFHHSNGQDGIPLSEDGSLNLATGNFSTNYIQIDYHWGRHHAWRNYHGRIGLEAHSGLLKIGDEPAYRDRFGKLRLNFQGSRSTYVRRFTKLLTDNDEKYQEEKERRRSASHEEFFRLVIEGMVVLDNIRAEWNQHINLELKAYFKIPGSENSAFFASLGYMGHDNYNIYFAQPYPFARLGIAASNAFMFSTRLNEQLKRIKRE